VEISCELGNEPSGSIKCWELPNGCTTCGPSSGTQLHRVIGAKSQDIYRLPRYLDILINMDCRDISRCTSIAEISRYIDCLANERCPLSIIDYRDIGYILITVEIYRL
jgi:hypothetical protein